MNTPALALVLAVVVSAVVRRLGRPKLFAFIVALTPAIGAFIFFLIRRDIEIGPHGGIFPAWIAAGVALALSAIVSAVTVHLVRTP
jgi:hypothetical protein